MLMLTTDMTTHYQLLDTADRLACVRYTTPSRVEYGANRMKFGIYRTYCCILLIVHGYSPYTRSHTLVEQVSYNTNTRE